MSVDARAVLRRVAAGGRMTREEGLVLYVEAETEALAETARRVRDRHTDHETVTYLVDRNIDCDVYLAKNKLQVDQAIEQIKKSIKQNAKRTE